MPHRAPKTNKYTSIVFSIQETFESFGKINFPRSVCWMRVHLARSNIIRCSIHAVCVCVCVGFVMFWCICATLLKDPLCHETNSHIYIYIASTYAVTRKVLLMKRRALLAHYGTIYTFDCDGAMRCVLSPDQNVLRALVIWYYGYRYFVGITHEMIPYYIIFWIGGGGRLRAIRDRVTLHQTFVFVGARLMGIRNVSSCGVNGGNSANHSVNAFKQSFILWKVVVIWRLYTLYIKYTYNVNTEIDATDKRRTTYLKNSYLPRESKWPYKSHPIQYPPPSPLK